MPQQTVDKIGRTPLSEDMPPRDAEEFSLRDGVGDSLSVHARLAELESEHFHLQRLVAELLIKNQKLRDMLRDQAGSLASTTAATSNQSDPSKERMHISLR
jgi:hypothetical protein